MLAFFLLHARRGRTAGFQGAGLKNPDSLARTMPDASGVVVPRCTRYAMSRDVINTAQTTECVAIA
jgi:hypothetical protein